MFDKRLDFLMNITHTSNAALAKAVNIDPSAVSRLRSGSRSLPKYPDFLPSMASYFSKKMIEDYQKRTVAEQICPGSPWVESSALASKMIYSWLLDGGGSQSYSTCVDSAARNSICLKTGYYYGMEGLHEATLSLLCSVIEDGRPRDILVIYEGDAIRFEDSPDFADKWLSLFDSAYRLGCRIKLIRNCKLPPHSVHERVKKWLPPCFSISMLPLSCPKSADVVHCRTLLIASGLLAAQSTIYKNSGGHDLVQLIGDKSAVRALEYEYNRYEELCLPISELLSIEPREKASVGTSFFSHSCP